MNKLNHLCLLLVLLLFPFISISAQEMNISGVVIDNDGLTMPGVSVSVKGTTTGTITDIDGKYNLNVQKGATLLFSFIGYTTKEVKVGNENILNITLNASTPITTHLGLMLQSAFVVVLLSIKATTL